MTSTRVDLVSGDSGRTEQFEFEGVDNLNDVTACEAHIWSATAGSAATLTAEVTDAVNRVVTVDFGDDEGWLATAAAGAWNLEIQVTTVTQPAITSPEGKPFPVIVRDQGA